MKTLTSDVGEYLSSRAVSSQVLSAQQSLTSVFGMGTGGPSALITPTYRSVFSTVLSISYSYPFVKHILYDLFETTYFSKLFPRKSAEIQSFDLSTLPSMHLQGFEPGTH